MENESISRPEPLSPDEAQAKAALLAECENLAAAGVTFVAVHFDCYGDSGVTEEVKCFAPEYCAYEEHKPVPADLVEGVFDTAPTLVFGRRPELPSGRRRRARPGVPEQPSLFGLR